LTFFSAADIFVFIERSKFVF